jgi:hypothetical protein
MLYVDKGAYVAQLWVDEEQSHYKFVKPMRSGKSVYLQAQEAHYSNDPAMEQLRKVAMANGKMREVDGMLHCLGGGWRTRIQLCHDWGSLCQLCAP